MKAEYRTPWFLAEITAEFNSRDDVLLFQQHPDSVLEQNPDEMVEEDPDGTSGEDADDM